MERLLEILIDYSETPLINFSITYPDLVPTPESEILLLTENLKNIQQKLEALERANQEKDSQLGMYDFKLQEQSVNFSSELTEKNAEIQALQDELEGKSKTVFELESSGALAQQRISELESLLEQKTGSCQKLQKTLQELKNNRKTAEVMLEKQEIMNKELIEKNVKYEKNVQDLEKKINELSKLIKKTKDESASSNEIMKQRDEQIKSVIRKVKVLEKEREKMLEDLKKKDDIIKNMQSNIKEREVVNDKSQLTGVNQKEYKKVMELVNVKESEIKIMKDMIKSFQAKQQRPGNQNNAAKNLKLPPISGNEKKGKNIERHIKFSEPSNASKKSLMSNGSSSFQKIRKDTPPPQRNKFNSLFTEKEENEDHVSANSFFENIPNEKSIESKQKEPIFNLKSVEKKINKNLKTSFNSNIEDIVRIQDDFEEKLQQYRDAEDFEVVQLPSARKKTKEVPIRFEGKFEDTKAEEEVHNSINQVLVIEESKERENSLRNTGDNLMVEKNIEFEVDKTPYFMEDNLDNKPDPSGEKLEEKELEVVNDIVQDPSEFEQIENLNPSKNWQEPKVEEKGDFNKAEEKLEYSQEYDDDIDEENLNF